MRHQLPTPDESPELTPRKTPLSTGEEKCEKPPNYPPPVPPSHLWSMQSVSRPGAPPSISKSAESPAAICNIIHQVEPPDGHQQAEVHDVGGGSDDDASEGSEENDAQEGESSGDSADQSVAWNQNLSSRRKLRLPETSLSARKGPVTKFSVRRGASKPHVSVSLNISSGRAPLHGVLMQEEGINSESPGMSHADHGDSLTRRKANDHVAEALRIRCEKLEGQVLDLQRAVESGLHFAAETTENVVFNEVPVQVEKVVERVVTAEMPVERTIFKDHGEDSKFKADQLQLQTSSVLTELKEMTRQRNTFEAQVKSLEQDLRLMRKSLVREGHRQQRCFDRLCMRCSSRMLRWFLESWAIIMRRSRDKAGYSQNQQVTSNENNSSHNCQSRQAEEQRRPRALSASNQMSSMPSHFTPSVCCSPMQMNSSAPSSPSQRRLSPVFMDHTPFFDRNLSLQGETQSGTTCTSTMTENGVIITDREANQTPVMMSGHAHYDQDENRIIMPQMSRFYNNTDQAWPTTQHSCGTSSSSVPKDQQLSHHRTPSQPQIKDTCSGGAITNTRSFASDGMGRSENPSPSPSNREISDDAGIVRLSASRYTPSVEKKQKRTQEDKDKEKAKPGAKELAAGRDEVNRKDHIDGSPLNPSWPPPARPEAWRERLKPKPGLFEKWGMTPEKIGPPGRSVRKIVDHDPVPSDRERFPAPFYGRGHV